jgi:hypothetical protein
MTRIALLLGLALLVGGGARGEDDPKKKKLEDLFAALKAKREAAPRQTYKISFDHGATARRVIDEWEFDIDWTSTQFRHYGIANRTTPMESHRIFDGEKLKTQFRELDANMKSIGEWKYGLVTGRLVSGDALNQYQFRPMYFHAGTIAGLRDTFYPGHLSFAPDAKQFYLHGEVQYDGRTCLSVKTFPEGARSQMIYEYIIDPKRDHSVVGFWYHIGTEPQTHIQMNTSLDKVTSRWRLDSWTVTTYGSKAIVLGTIRATCVHTPAGLPDAPKGHYDIVPPEGGTVGRSHYEREKGKADDTRDSYEYKVENGKLVQTSGPNEGAVWYRRHSVWLAFVATAVAGTFVFRRLWFSKR